MPDTLAEKTTINFPRTIDEGEAEELFRHLHTELDYEFRYTEKRQKRIGTPRQMANPEDDNYVQEISGGIHSLKKHPLTTMGFQLIRDSAGLDYKFAGFKFFTSPGDELEEVDPSDITLMDNVREGVKTYFSSSP